MKTILAEATMERKGRPWDETAILSLVNTLSCYRNYNQHPNSNRLVADTIRKIMGKAGYSVSFSGRWCNVIAVPSGLPQGSVLRAAAAHYDSPPDSPGADDNMSGVVCCITAARQMANKGIPAAFVFFNREEDGLLGSKDFCRAEPGSLPFTPSEMHVMECVGYTSKTQRLPKGMPLTCPDTGDFLCLLSNGKSKDLAAGTLEVAKVAVPHRDVIVVQISCGAEKIFPDLQRSDHWPFWRKGTPALMWTDTAEFRNPNYHAATDTPDTLDGGFLLDTADLLEAVLSRKEK